MIPFPTPLGRKRNTRRIITGNKRKCLELELRHSHQTDIHHNNRYLHTPRDQSYHRGVWYGIQTVPALGHRTAEPLEEHNTRQIASQCRAWRFITLIKAGEGVVPNRARLHHIGPAILSRVTFNQNSPRATGTCLIEELVPYWLRRTTGTLQIRWTDVCPIH